MTQVAGDDEVRVVGRGCVKNPTARRARRISPYVEYISRYAYSYGTVFRISDCRFTHTVHDGTCHPRPALAPYGTRSLCCACRASWSCCGLADFVQYCTSTVRVLYEYCTSTVPPVRLYRYRYGTSSPASIIKQARDGGRSEFRSVPRGLTCTLPALPADVLPGPIFGLIFGRFGETSGHYGMHRHHPPYYIIFTVAFSI